MNDDGVPKYLLDKFDSFGKVLSHVFHHSKESTFFLIWYSKYKFDSLFTYSSSLKNEKLLFWPFIHEDFLV